MATKLSKTQKEVVRLMREGWQVGKSVGIKPRAWMQNGGIGRGGESKTLNSNTFFALLDKKLIHETAEKYSIKKYDLTDFGKSIEL